MRKVIITLCFLFVAFVAQAGRISGINIQSSGEAILVFVMASKSALRRRLVSLLTIRAGTG